MNVSLERTTAVVGLKVSRRRNRELLETLFDDLDVVEIDGTVPDETDLCLIDDDAFSEIQDALDDWKATQRPTYAPVVLLAEAGDTAPWAQYADLVGETVDSIQVIPAPREAIRARIDAQLTARQYAQELAVERQLVDRIFETSPVAKTVLDTDGQIVRANERAEAVLGLSRSALSGRSYDAPEWRITDGDGEPIPSEELPFARVLATGEPIYDYEHGIEHPDGTEKWLSVNVAPLRDDQGEIEYVVSAIADITTQRDLQRQLRASEELHRITLENIQDTVVITDDDGRFTYVCPNVHHLFGYTEAAVREMGSIEALLGRDPTPPRLEERGTVENIGLTVLDKDGHEHEVLVTVTPVSIQDGTRLFSIRDVTELLETQGELRRQRERLDTVLVNAPLILLSIDRSGTIEVARGAQLDFLEFDTSKVRDQPVADALASYPTVLANVDRMLDGEAFGAEVQLGTRTFDVWHQPVGADGVVDRGVVVGRDVTRQKATENSLRESLERYESLFESIRDAIFITNVDGAIVNCNPAFTDLFGYPLDEILGRDAAVIYDDPAAFETLLTTAETQVDDPQFVQTVTYRAKSGRTFPGETNVSAIRDADGTRTGYISLVRDVSTREEQLQQLRVIDRVLQHNYHNEMQIIQANADRIAESTAGDISKQAATIASRSRKLLKRVDDDRRIRKFLADQPELTVVDASQLVRTVVDAVQEHYPSATITASCPETAPTVATSKVADAVEELVENAVIHADSDPVVEVIVETTDDVVEIVVTDNGPGIPENERAVVTGKRELSRAFHGTGLGLWFVRLVVHHCDGHLDFSETDSGGSSISITLNRSV